MADTKLSELTALTAPAVSDLLVLLDVSDTTMDAAGTDKKMLVSYLLEMDQSGAKNFADQVLSRPELKDYSETKTAPSSSSGTLTLDIANGNNFETTLTENVTTLTISNPSPTGKVCSISLVLTQGASAYTVAWGAAFKWAGGTAPDLTTANSIHVITAMTLDAGTTWYGFHAGSEMAVPV
jgi:hypothetical protein